MYLLLMHGRKDPRANLEDWGFNGPIMKVDWVHITYNSHFRVGYTTPEGDRTEAEMEFTDGCLHYDGCFYGDWELFDVGSWNGSDTDLQSRLSDFSYDKATMSDVLQEAWREYSVDKKSVKLNTWVRTRHGEEYLYREKNEK